MKEEGTVHNMTDRIPVDVFFAESKPFINNFKPQGIDSLFSL